MIVEWLLGLATTVVNALAGLANGFSPPAWFVNLDGTIRSVTQALDGLGVWANWPLIGACAVAVLGSWTLFGNVKLFRVGASHVPLVGGGGN